MRMIDTQILLHMMAGRRAAPEGNALASVSAKEFLTMYSQHTNRDSYYLSLRLGLHLPFGFRNKAGSPPNHPARRSSSDKILIDFNNEFPSVIEYSNFAVSHYINKQRKDLFTEAIGALPRHTARAIQGKLDFLFRAKFRCYALEEEAVQIGLQILSEFLSEHASKLNFKNSLRDALILGTAVKHRIPLQTEDKLLAKLAGKKFGADLYQAGDDIIVDFRSPAICNRKSITESKGYINKGWRISVDRQRNVV